MTAEDSYIVPFETSHEPDVDQRTAEIAEPFVGQWNQLVSTTNWEKGRIISAWRSALIEAEADPSQYSDEAWARSVGGVTAPHVGRLRRVYDRYGSTFPTYEGLYWTHFLVALEWEDGPLWLEGAAREGWSVSAMRRQRWEAHGAVASQRPTESQVIAFDLDEDLVIPAQGGGRTKQQDDEPGTSIGKSYENADFGDEEALSIQPAQTPGGIESAPRAETPVGPFAELPELPDDLSDAIEMLKLAVLRHKTGGWQQIQPSAIKAYLAAIARLVDEPQS